LINDRWESICISAGVGVTSGALIVFGGDSGVNPNTPLMSLLMP
jgi:hypothetical protein